MQKYISYYAPAPGSKILDPFGGSGVTAIEASVLGNIGIQYDINPLANFIGLQIARPQVNTANLLRRGSEIIETAKKISKGASSKSLCNRYWYPKDVQLPDNADVEYVEDLFTSSQLAELAVIRSLISEVRETETRDLLLLTFSSTLAKVNRTFVSAKNRAPSRGGATILSLYRYHVPNKPVELNAIEEFANKLKRVVTAKIETNAVIDPKKSETIFHNGSATDLTQTRTNSIDYIFTDPPYGSYINYIDLSTMWNAWLGLRVTEKQKSLEVIAEQDDDTKYFKLLRESAEECYRVLKQDHYLSLVFCHRDLSYWKKIYNMFEEVGFRYEGSVPQPLNTVWSMHKKKNDLSSIAGELIITFRKTPAKRQIKKPRDVSSIIRNVFGSNRTLQTDTLFLNLIPKLFECGAFSDGFDSRKEIDKYVREFLDYNAQQKVWKVKR